MRQLLCLLLTILTASQVVAAILPNHSGKEQTIKADTLVLSQEQVKLDSLTSLHNSLVQSCKGMKAMPMTMDSVRAMFESIDLLSGSIDPQCVMMVSLLQGTPVAWQVSKIAEDYTNLMREMKASVNVLNTIYSRDSVERHVAQLSKAKEWIRDGSKQQNEIDSICKLLNGYRWATRLLMVNIVESLLDAKADPAGFDEQVKIILSNTDVNNSINQIPYLRSRYEKLQKAVRKIKGIEYVDWKYIETLQAELIECRK